jgi:tetraacyldisaccharide 4'-kinase
VNAGRVARWLWGSSRAAWLARLPLVPLALVYGATMRVRAAAYRRGLFSVERLSLPVVAVGNLSVGGAGKTPLAAWIAGYYAARGVKPGILLRGYGADESLVHERLVPEALVVADPDRGAGARRALAGGAEVLVLDDAFQLLGVARDLNIVVVSAESARATRWAFPAGPWRESWKAVDRADWIVVTRKRAATDVATTLAAELATLGRGVPVVVVHLSIERLEGLQSGTRHGVDVLRGRRVVAAAGIADPESFAAQLTDLGASVQLVAYQDHQRYAAGEVERLVRAALKTDYVVVTEKDAVKLRGRWPRGVPEPLVAVLQLRWERDGRGFEAALAAALQASGAPRL